ncbi:MAG: YceI family protein [Thermoleophilia bacterium]|nr:YceI family protein [Thermoleophilia bacterium]
MHTGRGGAAAKAGHDLVIRVTAWRATLVVGEDAAGMSAELTADATSLRVIEGTGGVQSLGDDDKASIQQTIDDEILKREDIVFRSTAARPQSDGKGISLEGELTILGTTAPIGFDLAISEDGALSATAIVTQTAWDIKPYSTLFGTLKVKDEVEVVLEGHL